jgi:RHS repeat-associated protein
MLNPTSYAQVVDELQSGAVTKTYSYGLERISQNWQPTTGNWQPAFYGYDGHGSVRQLTNSAGTVTDSYDYDAFGNLINQTGSTPNNYLFASEQYDPALGLYYNRARYLNSPTGRFWSMDGEEGQYRQPQTLHRYLYADADPVDGTDPSGNQDSIAELSAEESVSITLDTMAVPQTPTQLVTVERIDYSDTNGFGPGVHIEIGARYVLRQPRYPVYRWVQMVTTNAVGQKERQYITPGVEYADPQPHAKGGDYFYLEGEEAAQRNVKGYDYVFQDDPHRNPPSAYPYLGGRAVRWKANLYLVGTDSYHSTAYTKIIWITYGFTVKENGLVAADDLHATRLLPSQQQLF